jgi:Ca2+-binding EF-hand superfamily protein
MKPIALSAVMALGLIVSTGAFAGDTPHEGHAVPSSAAAELQMMDTDKDGKVSTAEHAKGARSMFDSMDADRDGRVTAAEMDAAHKSQGMGGKAAAGKMSSAEKIKVVDTNTDGKLSAEEHVAGAQKMFSTMDTDKDGLLTAAELEKGHKTMLSAK